MTSIIQSITMPVQLSALFLLLLAFVLKWAINSGKIQLSGQNKRLLVDRVFQAGLAALVLGVLAPMLGPYLVADTVIRGTVLSSTTGAPIAGATVNIGVAGETQTNVTGNFELTVPFNRRLDSYRMTARAERHSSVELNVASNRVGSVELRLVPIILQNVPVSFEQPLHVAQVFGMPTLIGKFRIGNTTSSQQMFTNLRAILKSGDKTVNLFATQWAIQGEFGPYSQVTGPFPVSPGEFRNYWVVFSIFLDTRMLTEKLKQLDEHRETLPCQIKPDGSFGIIGSAAWNIIEPFVLERWFWTQGEWDVSIYGDFGGNNQKFTYQFSLSELDISKLKRSVGLMKSCMATYVFAPMAQDGLNENFVVR